MIDLSMAKCRLAGECWPGDKKSSNRVAEEDLISGGARKRLQKLNLD